MLKLYNTQSRRKEVFRPLVEGRVGIYTCGPTLHDFAQLGLIRRLLAVDLLKKVLQQEGYQVRHIVNLTDIDDKTIDASAKRGVRLEELTGQYASEFFADMATLRMSPADHYPRATEHVDDMIDVTKRLVDAGMAYEMQRSVYFNISRLASYGGLSRVDTSRVKAGATVDLDYYEKAEARDFTLLRRSDLAELRRRITYRTDWGNIRPGWHVECAAMAVKYLGVPFDIHTSGQDLLFPHNENENAICEAAWGRHMARWWMHSGLMLMGRRKMSRSAGTALTLRDLLARGYTGRQVRYALLGVHYRKTFAFTFDRMDEACRELARLDALVLDLRQVRGEGEAHAEVDDEVVQTNRRFCEALRDDLNAPTARARLLELAKSLTGRMRADGLNRVDAELALDFLFRVDRVLSVLDFSAEARAADPIDERLAERDRARAEGDYARADAIRGELEALGYVVEDTAGGTKVRRRPAGGV